MWLKFVSWLENLFPRNSISSSKVKEHYLWQWHLPKLIPIVSVENVRQLKRELRKDAHWSLNFIVCTVGACLIASFGLISNSTAVIIGAMLIAPLMLPLRALAFAALEGNIRLFWKALSSIIGATILALALSCLIGYSANIPEFGSEVTARTQPNLVDLGIAIAAGAISAFAKIRKEISDTLAGTAIAVALMPPLCVVGLALSQGLYHYSVGAFLLYITNLLGITLACMVVLILAGYTDINHTLGWTLLLTGGLLFPLSNSFIRLVQQEKLESEITKTLIYETITVGQEVQKTQINVDWFTNPPLVHIILQTSKEITAKQAKLVEEFISKRMGQPFQVVLLISQLKQISVEDELREKQLETEGEIEAEIIKTLKSETITIGEEAERTKIKIDWESKPPLVYVIMQTTKDITTNQVSLVQDFISQKMGQPFKVVFLVNELKVISAEDEQTESNQKTEKNRKEKLEYIYPHIPPHSTPRLNKKLK